MNWKNEIKQLRESYYLANYQSARDHGVPKKLYSDTTANSLTNAICDFLKFNGCYANRINSMGTMRKIDGQMKWTKGSTNRGTADIACIINGRAVSIEIKIGADKMSEAQHKEKARIEKAGGVYVVVRNMEEFCCWYNGFAATNCKQQSKYNGYGI